MAKNDNSITCLALLVGVLIFIMYLKCSNKVIEGHEATPEALAAAIEVGADVRTSRPEFEECIKSCHAIHLADSTPQDRLQLVKDIKDYKTLALTQETQATDTTQAVQRQLDRIRAFEGRFTNFTSEGDAGAPAGSPAAQTGLCAPSTGPRENWTLESDEDKAICWDRAVNMFNTLRRVRQAYHSLPGTPNDMPKAYGGTADAEAGQPIAEFNASETGKGRYEALNPNRARKDSSFETEAGNPDTRRVLEAGEANGGTMLPLGWGNQDNRGAGWNTETSGDPSTGFRYADGPVTTTTTASTATR
tara:strand:- start:313 stop:1224 length:912 start_codon:yes stop_codon:yes gene_type:complete